MVVGVSNFVRLLAIVVLTIASFVSFNPIGHGFANPLELEGPKTPAQIVGNVEYFLDDTGKITIDEIATDSFTSKFKPVESEFINFGFTKSLIWLKVNLRNASEDHDRWMLFFRENFFQKFSAYQINTGSQIQVITEQDEEAVFGDRPIKYPYLVVPVKLKPGEEAEVFVRYWSGGSSEVRFSIETDASFNEKASSTVFKNSLYYGMLVLMLMVSGAAFLYSRKTLFFAYSASTMSSLLFIMQADGTAFQYLWPNWPQFNGFASLPIGNGLIFFGALFAREFLQTKRYHKIADKILIFFMVLAAVATLSAVVLDTQLLKQFMLLISLFAFLFFFIAGLLAARKRFKEVRFYVLAWGSIMVVSVLLTFRENFGLEISEELQFDLMRMVMVADAAFMGLGLLDRYNQIRVASQQSMKASLKQARRNLKLTQRLNDLEQKFSAVSELAESRDQEVKNTVHDLRQPLHALRLKVHDLMQGNDSDKKTTSDVAQTFTYLEKLVSTQLGKAAEDTKIVSGENLAIRDEADDLDNSKSLTTDEILLSVHDMFQNDAIEKGIELKYLPSNHDLDIENLVLMRLATNLVSNAIKYTDQGKVEFGIVDGEEGLRLQVADTGAGMTEAEFSAVLDANIRLEEGARRADGIGLGLSIVREISNKHGLKLSLGPDREFGTAVRVDFPA